MFDGTSKIRVINSVGSFKFQSQEAMTCARFYLMHMHSHKCMHAPRLIPLVLSFKEVLILSGKSFLHSPSAFQVSKKNMYTSGNDSLCTFYGMLIQFYCYYK